MHKLQLPKQYNAMVKHTIRLNIPLIISLGRVLGMTNAELMNATGIMNATWYRIISHPEQVTVQQLISIANGLSIPVRRLFLYDDTDMVYNKDYYIENPYKQCYYDTNKLQYLIDTQTVSTWQDVAETLGLSRSILRNSLLLNTRLPLNRFLKACDVFGIDPFCVIIDPNPLHIKQQKQTDVISTKEEYAEIKQDISIMKSEMAILRAEVMNIRRVITRLDKKIDIFIDDHYEELHDYDDQTPQATLARQTVKEIQTHKDEKITNKEEIKSLPSL